MTVNERDRVIAPAQGSTALRVKVLAAVRPERIAIAKGSVDAGEGSRPSGTVAQIVYLGAPDAVHVDTAAEPVHRAPAVSEASDTSTKATGPPDPAGRRHLDPDQWLIRSGSPNAAGHSDRASVRGVARRRPP
jgi:hypothetical protein